MVAHLAPGKGKKKPYPGQPFAWGNMLIHHPPPPPVASFLAGDTCKLTTSLCYLVRTIMLQIHFYSNHAARGRREESWEACVSSSGNETMSDVTVGGAASAMLPLLCQLIIQMFN